MEIIIEGCDGTGKSTVVQKLKEKYNCDILSMTKEGDKTVRGYEEKAKLHNIISDRSFISEWVYSKVYGKKSELTKNWFGWLLDYEYRKYKIFVLTCDPNVIMQRINERGIDKEDLTNITKLNQEYKNLAQSHSKRINIIDTTNLTCDQVYGQIVSKVEELDGI